jgi:hypothetical protein
MKLGGKKIGVRHLAMKKNWCLIWRQPEIKHGRKKNRCCFWRQAEIIHFVSPLN